MNMKRVDVASMFSVPIIRTQIKPWETIKEQILDIVERSEFKLDCYDGGFQTDYYNDDNTVGSDYHDEVYEILKPYITSITQQCFNYSSPEKPSTMWSQKYTSNTEHTVHNHGNRGFSFILYLKFNPEVHKPTRFLSPFGDFFTGSVNHFDPQVQEGDLIAFPSNILHTSQRQNTDEERMILSFNLFPDGFPT